MEEANEKASSWQGYVGSDHIMPTPHYPQKMDKKKRFFSEGFPLGASQW